MPRSFSKLAVALWLGCCRAAFGALTPEQAALLPPPAGHEVDFMREIKPIFESSCINCHGRGRDKGGLKLDTRDTLLKGGDSGPTIAVGNSAGSYLIQLVQGFDPDEQMPKKGTKLTREQIGILRAWIDQGARWDASVTFARLKPNNLEPRRPEIPSGPKDANPIDLFLQPYFTEHLIKPMPPVADRVYARRVYLDVIGLLPPPEELESFVADKHSDKRARLVQKLLGDNFNYAQNWMTFWNDALRNDYRGTGYIDGGRKQITAWLYAALATNMPYDRFVAQLIDPAPASEGFSKGIVWRGVVNASQTPQMQTAQNISQVFMGVNLKCASCHDSFINDLTLEDAYGLAGIYSDSALEMVHCDKPVGKKAALKFLYPELGQIDPAANKAARLRRLAEIVTEPKDGRLTRTIVNRYWQRFLGRGLVEPVDEMEKTAWNSNLLDWLAADLADHHYDLKHLIELILTSRAYQMPAVSYDEKRSQEYVFNGPMVRRMTAEQFRDALGELTGIWYEQPAGEIDYTLGRDLPPANPAAPVRWIWDVTNAAAAAKPGTVYFRKTIQIDKIPSHALAFVAADNSFTLYVNGKKAGAGKDLSRLNVFNIRKELRKGANTLAVAAVNEGAQPNPAGLFVYAFLRQKERGRTAAILDAGTDASWLCSSEKVKDWEKPKFDASNWKPAIELGGVAMLPWNMETQFRSALAAPDNYGKVRAVLANADVLQVALGRPNREQTVTTRLSAATTLEALELTNGRELADLLRRGAQNALEENGGSGEDLIRAVYARALGRKPTTDEMKLARGVVGQPAASGGVQDLLWAVTMLPEFQLIY